MGPRDGTVVGWTGGRQTVVGSLFISGGHNMTSTNSPQRDGIGARSGRVLKVCGTWGWDRR